MPPVESQHLPRRKQLQIPLEVTVLMEDITKAQFWLLCSPHTPQMTWFLLRDSLPVTRQSRQRHTGQAGPSPYLKYTTWPFQSLAGEKKDLQLLSPTFCLANPIFTYNFNSQGENRQHPCLRRILSRRAPEMWYFNSCPQPLPWEHIMWSLAMGKPLWVSRFESVPGVRVPPFLTI